MRGSCTGNTGGVAIIRVLHSTLRQLSLIWQQWKVNMKITRIEYGGGVICHVVEQRNSFGKTYYEIVFPHDETLKSITKDSLEDVNFQLDYWLGVGWWRAQHK